MSWRVDEDVTGDAVAFRIIDNETDTLVALVMHDRVASAYSGVTLEDRREAAHLIAQAPAMVTIVNWLIWSVETLPREPQGGCHILAVGTERWDDWKETLERARGRGVAP